MRHRRGFGAYMLAPGMTAIGQVRDVLAELDAGSRAYGRARRRLVAAGLDIAQALALIRLAKKVHAVSVDADSPASPSPHGQFRLLEAMS